MSVFPLAYLGGGRFETTPYHAARLDYGQGEIITVEEVQERSQKSHAHFFASIANAWANLPENIADDFRSPEHLRKYCLIRAGYATEVKMTLPTNTEAIAAAAFVGQLDSFAICQVVGRVVTVWRAESQSMKAMRKTRFQQSKTDCLRVLSELLGADVGSLEKAEAA